jgi:predicted  nucleic acid-binding Zn-ribbon protein
MKVKTDKDFAELTQQFSVWRKRFPMFTHDVQRIEKIINQHITAHSKIMVMYRQTKSRSYLEQAQREIDAINTVLTTVEKMELMSLLSRG